ncbi:MAG: hypothetical protein MJ170_02720 [Alphaproteobacteria bacterium]|nr:hypothetical protein [Alphaproteobacteria bacterium]
MKKQFITKSNVQGIFKQVKSLLNDCNVNVLMCKTNPHLKYKSIGKYMQPKIGDELEINATIKEHSEYRGIKQTIIQRVVVE